MPHGCLAHQFLPQKQDQATSGVQHVLIIYFTDPVTVNKCIEHHIAFRSRLLPTVKFARCPPQCYNCQHIGHLAKSCRRKPRCGLCAEAHDTRQCENRRVDGHLGQPVSLKCAVCWGPHAAVDTNCPVRRGALDGHWSQAALEGPFFHI